jgi:hypothetical protein
MPFEWCPFNPWSPNPDELSLNVMVNGYQMRLKAVVALQGRSLNGHRDVIRALTPGETTLDQIQAARKQEEEAMSRFREESQRFFEVFPTTGMHGNPTGMPGNSARSLREESHRFLQGHDASAMTTSLSTSLSTILTILFSKKIWLRTKRIRNKRAYGIDSLRGWQAMSVNKQLECHCHCSHIDHGGEIRRSRHRDARFNLPENWFEIPMDSRQFRSSFPLHGTAISFATAYDIQSFAVLGHQQASRETGHPFGYNESPPPGYSRSRYSATAVG